MATVMPAEAKDKALYLYHPTLSTSAQRIDLTKEGAAEKITTLKREGWTEKRFAQTLFHRTKDAKLVTDPKEVPILLKQGWLEAPYKAE